MNHPLADNSLVISRFIFPKPKKDIANIVVCCSCDWHFSVNYCLLYKILCHFIKTSFVPGYEIKKRSHKIFCLVSWVAINHYFFTLDWVQFVNYWNIVHIVLQISFLSMISNFCACKQELIECLIFVSGPQIRVRNKKVFFLFLNQNICCGYSKEPSQWDGFFEHPKHMFKVMDKKIIAILFAKNFA